MIKSLQSLRFAFALMIFLHHSAFNLASFGAFPVSFFLILSGFVMMKGYGNRIDSISYDDFIKRRVLRIYPTHLLCLIIAIVVKFIISAPIEWWKTLPCLFLLQAWIPDSSFYFAGNSVSWYLSVILFCYFMFPIFVKVVKKHLWTLWGSFLLIYCVLVFVLPKSYQHAVLYINPFLRSFDFICGMTLYSLLGKTRLVNLTTRIKTYSIRNKTILEVGAIVVPFLFVFVSERFQSVTSYSINWWLPSLLLIMVFSTMDGDGGLITKLLSRSPLVFLGSISFAFYMLHISVLWLNSYLTDSFFSLNFYLDGVIVLSILLILAYFVTYYFEPLFKQKR